MRTLEGVVFMVLILALFTGIFFLWMNIPTDSVEFQSYVANISENLPVRSSQFYANMRYRSNNIAYSIDSACSEEKTAKSIEAFNFLENNTVLRFYRSDNPEIEITCSNLAPPSDHSDHFIAGEGGPTKILNATRYAVILQGKVSLYRSEHCEKPQVAIHEILHALGFDHNNNESSIMYPETRCDQVLDQYIIDEIAAVYSQQPLPDLVIENIIANKTGRYLNFEISIANQGLSSLQDSKLIIYTNGAPVKEFPLDVFEIGTTRKITASNIKMPSGFDEVTFKIETNEREISVTNNTVRLGISG